MRFTIDQIPHVERIRFHTRLPVVLPARVTPELIAMLTGLRAQPIVVVHANHANELVGDCAIVLRDLVRSGIPVLNQAVLLAGVNDNLGAMEMLCRRLINLGVMPYYLHQRTVYPGPLTSKRTALGQQWLIRNLAALLRLRHPTFCSGKSPVNRINLL